MKKSGKFLSFAFLLIIGAFALASFLLPDRDFSQRENRNLADYPTWSWQDFRSGRFTSDFDEYLADQFPLRDAFMDIKISSDHVLQKKENENIYFGKDGFLLERCDAPGQIFQDNISYIQAFAEANPYEVFVLPVPTSTAVYADKLPFFAPSADQGQSLRMIQNTLTDDATVISTLDALVSQKDQYLYFRLDHHWTQQGAYVAYQQLAPFLGYIPLSPASFSPTLLTDQFRGSYYAKSGYFPLEPDSIYSLEPIEPYTSWVEFTDDGTTLLGFLSPTWLEKGDPYSVFLDGNHASMIIHTDLPANVDCGKLLVVKDSYAHALLPLLANHFGEIHVLDLRYFRQDVSSYMADHEIPRLFIVAGLQNLNTDLGFYYLSPSQREQSAVH